MPVPVSNSTPHGNTCSRKSQPTSSSKGALDAFDARRAGKDLLSLAADVQLDRRFANVEAAVVDEDSRPKPAAFVPHFGLGKVKRVVAFDVAARKIVADGEADNLSGARNKQRQFRLGDDPFRVGSQTQRLAGPAQRAGVALKNSSGLGAS